MYLIEGAQGPSTDAFDGITNSGIDVCAIFRDSEEEVFQRESDNAA